MLNLAYTRVLFTFLDQKLNCKVKEPSHYNQKSDHKSSMVCCMLPAALYASSIFPFLSIYPVK